MEGKYYIKYVCTAQYVYISIYILLYYDDTIAIADWFNINILVSKNIILICSITVAILMYKKLEIN